MTRAAELVEQLDRKLSCHQNCPDNKHCYVEFTLGAAREIRALLIDSDKDYQGMRDMQRKFMEVDHKYRSLLAAAPPREPTEAMMQAAYEDWNNSAGADKPRSAAEGMRARWRAMYDAALGAGAKGTDGPFLASDCNSDTASDSRTYRIGADPSQARRAEIAAHPHNAGEQHWPLPNGFPRNQSAATPSDVHEATPVDDRKAGGGPAADPLVTEIELAIQQGKDRIIAVGGPVHGPEAAKLDAVLVLLQRARDEIVSLRQDYVDRLQSYIEKVAAIEAELAEAQDSIARRSMAYNELAEKHDEARKDAERYRWLKDNVGEFWHDSLGTLPDDRDQLDAAIDAARGAEHG